MPSDSLLRGFFGVRGGFGSFTGMANVQRAPAAREVPKADWAQCGASAMPRPRGPVLGTKPWTQAGS
eukprot:scaffold3953_cov236-Pinguiococcus_pyrenoidosus.AAC.5